MFPSFSCSSFTWSSSRLDRNLITVITGQAVETFDLQFRELYLLSRGVSLTKVPMADEPIPDPLPQAAPAPVSTAVARKLINPKYALVATGTHTSPSSSDQNSTNKNSQNPTGLKTMKGRLRGVVEEPSIHPGLANLEKAYLIPYLPTWPEPDPPSDVIGFINIRDEKRAHQVHLQRSERFEVSQAIRFSSPLTQPAQTDAKTGGTANNPPGNKSPDAPTPVSPTKKQVKEQTHINKTETTDSTDASQQVKTPPAQDAPKPNAQTPKAPTKITAESPPKVLTGAKETPDAPAAAQPVPKRRTLHLVIDSVPSEQLHQPLVTLVKFDQLENPEKNGGLPPGRGRRMTSGDDGDEDSGSNEGGSQDSTKVMCDRAANEEPSSASTASEEEFYDASSAMTNGVTTGSGRGHRQGDGVTVMARLSQSMLDLREPGQSEDSKDLLRQSQQLRRQGSPHRHIGQVR